MYRLDKIFIPSLQHLKCLMTRLLFNALLLSEEQCLLLEDVIGFPGCVIGPKDVHPIDVLVDVLYHFALQMGWLITETQLSIFQYILCIFNSKQERTSIPQKRLAYLSNSSGKFLTVYEQ